MHDHRVLNRLDEELNLYNTETAGNIIKWSAFWLMVKFWQLCIHWCIAVRKQALTFDTDLSPLDVDNLIVIFWCSYTHRSRISKANL